MESYNAHKAEEEALKFWKENRIYEQVKEKNKGKKRFYFLDGPPYTSGKVHLGTAWNKSLKDSVLRYKRMQGLDVWDRAGYDMHGLPTEHKIQEKHKLKDKDEIVKFGVAKFVDECKKFSIENMLLMNKTFAELGCWMDYENAYQSISDEFINGVWWLVKRADEQKRLYEGFKTMTWCADCGTALAKHELDYKEVSDRSIFVKFPVKGTKNEFLIIWTTTPWTIPFNLAVMVNPELEYVKAKVENEIWIVAKGLANIMISSVADKKFEIIETFFGEKLEGLKYHHPFEKDIPLFKDIKAEKLHSVLLSEEYVDLSAGSGLVHCAPGCGPEDYEVGVKNGLPAFNNIDESGTFPKEMGKFAGLRAKKDDNQFIKALEDSGLLINTSEVDHDYAHCWRCGSPVVFRATKQWFFKVEDLKEKMRELNKGIKWVPDWAGNRQFDSWLANLRDNSITRQRFWGTPVPIWKCEECGRYTVIGSIDDLKKSAKEIPDDLHKPWIDEVKIKCECGSIKKRIPDILDVWIDAGTTSWTCLDYPSNKELFKELWPADFILEGKDQIRGWFNLLFVASMIGMEKPSYKSVYMHGFVQDAKGRKMSKSLGNYILPEEITSKYGADALRCFFIGGACPGLDINYNEEGVKLRNKNLGVLWNTHNYLIGLSRELGKKPSELDSKIIKDLSSVEEKYIISRLNSTIKHVTHLFEEYRINEVPDAIESLFLDISRTYIQLIREKINNSDEEKEVVMHTLNRCIFDVLKIMSPICPFITEIIYQNMKEEFGMAEESIHLMSWPKYNQEEINLELENSFEIIDSIIQSGLGAREKIQMGVRWPLKEIIIVSEDKETLKSVEILGNLVKSQLNVKEIKVMSDMPLIKKKVKANYKELAPVFADKTPLIVSKLAEESTDAILHHFDKEGKYMMKIGKEELEILPNYLIVEREVPTNFAEGIFRKGFVYLNKDMDEHLEAEGYSREIMRRIQSMRKDAGLQKTDKISLFIRAGEEMAKMLEIHTSAIKERVGAEKIKISSLNPAKKHKHESKEKIKGEEFELHFDLI